MSQGSYIGYLSRIVREYGQAIIYFDQLISLLKSVVKSNAYTILSLSQSGYQDIREVVRVMGLSPEQADYLLRLNPGEAIIRKAGGYPYPQLIKIPFVKPRNLSDRELDRINQNDPLIQQLLSKVKKSNAPASPDTENREKEVEIKLNDNEKLLTEAIFFFQFKMDYPSTGIYKAIGLSNATGSYTLDKLREKNLIETVEVNFGKRGRVPKYPVLIKAGYEAIGKKNIFYAKGAGPEHKVYQFFLADHYSIFQPKIECNRNGKFIDVAFETDDLFVGMEVANTAKHERKNIEKDLSIAKADFVIVGCKDEKVLNKVEGIITELPSDIQLKVRAFLLSELLTLAPDDLIKKIQE